MKTRAGRCRGKAVSKRLAWGLALLLSGLSAWAAGQERTGAGDGPLAWWTFDGVEKGRVRDNASGARDELGGNFRVVRGVAGRAVKFDGYSTVVKREAAAAPRISAGLTVEAWVAVAAYPWNFCPVVVQEIDGVGGYALEIGPRGEVVFRTAAGGTKRECLAKERLPGRTWVHLAGVYEKGRGLTVYINGSPAGQVSFAEAATPAPDAEFLIGSVPEKRKPAAIHRQFGTLPSWFSLDAIIDEVKVYGRGLSEDEVRREFQAVGPIPAPEIPARVLPSGPPGPGRFGAVYTRLSYYWEWDELWRVAEEPDVVVRFPDSPVRLVFWRGTRYSPAWVTENNLWMADQSVEAWNGQEGCFEHMQDPLCLYSHVRVLENTEARVVVHWRYAPVSAYNHLWKVDPRTGWALWIDEYYYIYPDRTAVRKITWQKGSLGEPHQFQESIPLTSPGQLQGDVVNPDYVTVANLAGDKQVFSYVPNPPRKTSKRVPPDPTVQMHNLKAVNKPFIIFEPGSRMDYLRDMNIENLSRPGSCVHWPEGLLPCDGRTGLAADRATSFLGFPITDPVLHEGRGSRSWANSLYGMTDRPFENVLALARSWSKAPGLRVTSGRISSGGYDMSQRAYILECEEPGKPGRAEFEIAATAGSPASNVCLIVRNWGEKPADAAVDGRALTPKDRLRLGYNRSLSGTDLVIWIEKSSARPVRISLAESESRN